MHDTFLLEKISTQVHTLCVSNKINKVTFIKVVVHPSSHINETNLKEHFMNLNKKLFVDDLKIEIVKDSIEQQTAIIETIRGEQVGE